MSTNRKYSLYLNPFVPLSRRCNLCRSQIGLLSPRCNRSLNRSQSQNQSQRLLLFPHRPPRHNLNQLRPQNQKPPLLW